MARFHRKTRLLQNGKGGGAFGARVDLDQNRPQCTVCQCCARAFQHTIEIGDSGRPERELGVDPGVVDEAVHTPFSPADVVEELRDIGVRRDVACVGMGDATGRDDFDDRSLGRVPVEQLTLGRDRSANPPLIARAIEEPGALS